MFKIKAVRRFSFIALSLAVASLALLAMMPPLLAIFKQYTFYDSVMAFFAKVCHQQATRCFWWGGFPMAICGRCLGIYLGVAYAFLRQAFEQAVTWQMALLLLFLGVCDKIIETFWGIPSFLVLWSNELRCIAGFLSSYAVITLIFKSIHLVGSLLRRLKK